MKSIVVGIGIAVGLAAAGGIARAQVPPGGVPAGPGSNPYEEPADSAARATDSYGQPVAPVAPHPTAEAPAPPPPPPRPPDPPIAMPELLRSPTGWLLPAAVIYTKTSIDTGGGEYSNIRVGLGDVAEFGVSTVDTVLAQTGSNTPSTNIQPYVTATFRMGVAEDRLFSGQPGVTLGFEKSFQRNYDGFATRIAELTLVASEHVGKHAAIHVGGAFYDASIDGDGEGASAQPHDFLNTSLHQEGLANQIVPFGGIQLEPINRSEIIIDLSWQPEFCYQCNLAHQQTIQLQPELSWGVRYRVTDWMNLESGVRLPNIGSANLLDAQIFGSVTLTTWGLRHVVDGLQ